MSQLPPIAPADPHAVYLQCKAEIDAAVVRVLSSGKYILGPEGEALETEFARYLGAAGAANVANGTDAIEVALRAAGVGPGDQVATVANTVTATVAAVAATGARPVFVEIEPATMLMSADALAKALARDRGIKAVLPVHLYGLSCDMPAIQRIAQEHSVPVVEDCAQAHGAAIAGRKAGTWGDLAAFSFYPTKNLGAFGDGGAVVGMNSGMLDRVRLLRQYGWRTRYVSELPGRNSRLDEMQCAILRVLLARLDAGNAHRSRLAAIYLERLKSAPLTLPSIPSGRTHAWHQFVVRTPQRDQLKDKLAARGIHCGVLYPVPVHHQPAYRADVSLPETEQACREVLSLPLHLGLSEADAHRVADAVLMR